MGEDVTCTLLLHERKSRRSRRQTHDDDKVTVSIDGAPTA